MELREPTRQEQVDFLVSVKFPNVKAYRFEVPVSLANFRNNPGPSAEETERRKQYLASAAAYATELARLQPAALREAYDVAQAKYWEGVRKSQEREEAQRSYNQPYAMANFRSCARSAYWSVEEGAAILLGRSPNSIGLALAKRLQGSSPLAARYVQLHDWLYRANAVGELLMRTPASFVAWAKRMQIEVPQELDQAVAAFQAPTIGRAAGSNPFGSTNLVNWAALNSAHEREKQAQARVAELEADLSESSEARRKAATRIAELEAELERLKQATDTASAKDRSPGPRETDTMRKLIIGMAVRAYLYDPQAARNAASKEIADDLAELGISIDEDTVRKHLANAAGDHLPREGPPQHRRTRKPS